MKLDKLIHNIKLIISNSINQNCKRFVECKRLWKMSTNRYARGAAAPKNGNMRLISGCCDFPLPTFSTCGGPLLAMTYLFRFTLFISGFAHRLPGSQRQRTCGILSNRFITEHVVIPLRFLKLQRSAPHFAYATGRFH